MKNKKLIPIFKEGDTFIRKNEYNESIIEISYVQNCGYYNIYRLTDKDWYNLEELTTKVKPTFKTKLRYLLDEF